MQVCVRPHRRAGWMWSWALALPSTWERGHRLVVLSSAGLPTWDWLRTRTPLVVVVSRDCKLQEAAAASRLLRQVHLSLPGTYWLFWPPQEASHWVCLLELCRGSIDKEETDPGLVAWVTLGEGRGWAIRTMRLLPAYGQLLPISWKASRSIPQGWSLEHWRAVAEPGPGRGQREINTGWPVPAGPSHLVPVITGWRDLS